MRSARTAVAVLLALVVPLGVGLPAASADGVPAWAPNISAADPGGLSITAATEHTDNERLATLTYSYSPAPDPGSGTGFVIKPYCSPDGLTADQTFDAGSVTFLGFDPGSSSQYVQCSGSQPAYLSQVQLYQYTNAPGAGGFGPLAYTITFRAAPPSACALSGISDFQASGAGGSSLAFSFKPAPVPADTADAAAYEYSIAFQGATLGPFDLTGNPLSGYAGYIGGSVPVPGPWTTPLGSAVLTVDGHATQDGCHTATTVSTLPLTPGPTTNGGSDPDTGTSCGWTDLLCSVKSALRWAFVPTQLGAQTSALMSTVESHQPFADIVGGPVEVLGAVNDAKVYTDRGDESPDEDGIDSIAPINPGGLYTPSVYHLPLFSVPMDPTALGHLREFVTGGMWFAFFWALYNRGRVLIGLYGNGSDDPAPEQSDAEMFPDWAAEQRDNR